MAYGRKTGGRNFVKGQSGNPKGRPVTLPELRNVKKMSVDEFKTLISFFLYCTEAEAQSVIDDPGESLIKKALAKAILVGSATGDMKQFSILTDRLFGKVKEEIDLSVKRPSILVKRDGSQYMFQNHDNKEIESQDE